MPAGQFDFVKLAESNNACEQGATFSREIFWKDERKQPVDLTGYTARMQVRARTDASTTIVELTTANSKITLTPSTGKIALTISASDTASLAAGTYLYDLEMVNGSAVYRLLEGKFEVYAEVTR